MFTAKCPICEEKIDLSKKVKYLERVTCPTCDALLEVVNMDPLQLDWIYYDEYYDSNGKERSMNPRSAKCPLCREVVYIGSHAKVGGRILCPGCDAQLEIVSMVPIELDWPYDAEYDSYF
jgi:lysine biosynthesis protein LysW